MIINSYLRKVIKGICADKICLIKNGVAEYNKGSFTVTTSNKTTTITIPKGISVIKISVNTANRNSNETITLNGTTIMTAYDDSSTTVIKEVNNKDKIVWSWNSFLSELTIEAIR